MTNIVSGLRRIAEEGYRFAGDAADEIERLQGEIYELKAGLRILLGKEDFGETIDWVQRAMRAEAEITRLKQPAHT